MDVTPRGFFSPEPRVVETSAYAALLIDDPHDVLILSRKSKAFASPEHMESTMRGVFARVEGLVPRPSRLLFDLREGPLRTEPSFDVVMRKLTVRFFLLARGFVRHALLVKTAVGSLQMNRQQRENGPERTGIFQDEARAYAYLMRAEGAP